MGEKKKKTVKTIKVDVDKCNGCRACEVACSAFHAAPRYSSNNPARARIRVIREPIKDIYIPVYAGEYTPAECAGRDKYTIDGKQYDECGFCRASCPSRDVFKEPDSGPDTREALVCPVVLGRCPDLRRKGRGSRRRGGAGGVGDRIGSIGKQVWIRQDDRHRRPNVTIKEGITQLQGEKTVSKQHMKEEAK
jgi:ferredoxin